MTLANVRSVCVHTGDRIVLMNCHVIKIGSYAILLRLQYIADWIVHTLHTPL